jgi:outer membrane protein assembly factor BamD
LLFAVVLTACSGGRATTPLAPEDAYAQGMTAFRQGNYRRALDRFRQAEAGLAPRAEAMADVRFHIAECQLAMDRSLEAAQLFRRVADDFPSHRLAPHALLRAGDANAVLWTRAELDPTFGQSALAAYRELLARYPDADVSPRARARVLELQERFAEKDYKTGVFYLQRRAYDSAILYFRSLVANYGQASYVPDALLKLIEIYDRIGYLDEQAETCRFLRQQYPETPGLDEACPVVP